MVRKGFIPLAFVSKAEPGSVFQEETWVSQNKLPKTTSNVVFQGDPIRLQERDWHRVNCAVLSHLLQCCPFSLLAPALVRSSIEHGKEEYYPRWVSIA